MKTPETELFEIAESHMTVPFGFRRMAKIPEILVLRRVKLQADEIVMKEGYKITTPLRTLIDLVRWCVSRGFTSVGFQGSKKKGLITKHAIEINQRCPAEVIAKLLKMMQEAHG